MEQQQTIRVCSFIIRLVRPPSLYSEKHWLFRISTHSSTSHASVIHHTGSMRTVDFYLIPPEFPGFHDILEAMAWKFLKKKV